MRKYINDIFDCGDTAITVIVARSMYSQAIARDIDSAPALHVSKNTI